MSAFYIVAWGILGLINLCGKQVSKFSYALTWIMLMVVLIFDYFGV